MPGGKVLVLCDVDTGSVSRGGIFADGAQAQAVRVFDRKNQIATARMIAT